MAHDVRIYFDDDEIPDTQPDFAWPPASPPPSSYSQPPESPQPPAVDQLGGFGPSNFFDFTWSPLPRPPIPPEERREIFNAEVGPMVSVTDPYEAFMAIWGPIIDHIVTETNKYK